jgi:hypothetical protein
MRKVTLFCVCMLLVVASAALADTNINYVNRSGRTLYVYYATAPNNVTIACSNMTYGGELQPGGSWAITVPGGKWGWAKFQLDTSTQGCGISNNKFESKITGYNDARSETVNVN